MTDFGLEALSNENNRKPDMMTAMHMCGGSFTEDSPVKRPMFIQEQASDPKIKDLMSRAVSVLEAHNLPSCFYFRSGVHMGKWRYHTVPSNHSWETIYQIVLPM